MRFTHDTEPALVAVTALVNSGRTDTDTLATTDDLGDFLDTHGYTGRHDGDVTELQAVRALRDRLARFWDLDRDAAAAEVNRILRESGARPFVTRHDTADWHIHVTDSGDPLADRIGAETAMAFVDLIRADEFDRLRTCVADDCDCVLIDMSRNRSRRFCAERNCGNRASVAAYRARRSQITHS
ncbi:CGNR zinc finger domain-containing protein [Williamsia herbipolensis]|uniref:CGNR zinc finger domain-containing protein n=1 Tax=Williamsia herbipolensis TaxID=1603258 RepID=UPI0005F81364|nr:CGNR zinc finger domain-containing protein [Williamsia herbipolensis]